MKILQNPWHDEILSNRVIRVWWGWVRRRRHVFFPTAAFPIVTFPTQFSRIYSFPDSKFPDHRLQFPDLNIEILVYTKRENGMKFNATNHRVSCSIPIRFKMQLLYNRKKCLFFSIKQVSRESLCPSNWLGWHKPRLEQVSELKQIWHWTLLLPIFT